MPFSLELSMKTNMKYLTALLFGFFLMIVPLKGQNGLSSNQQLWLEGLVNYSFGKKWDFYTDASYRQIFSEKADGWRVMVRPSIKWKILNWLDVRGGFGVFYTNFDNKIDLLEVRPWQGFAVVWPSIKRLKFTHQVRFEQRIIYNTTDWAQANINRYRYQLSTKINLSKDRKYKIFFIPLEVEFFFNSDQESNKLVQNEGRYTIGLGYVFNQKITVDGKFFAQRVQSDEFNLNVSDYVLRLRFKYNLLRSGEDKTKT